MAQDSFNIAFHWRREIIQLSLKLVSVKKSGNSHKLQLFTLLTKPNRWICGLCLNPTMPLLVVSLMAKEGGLLVLVLWKIRKENPSLWSCSGHCGQGDSEHKTRKWSSEAACLTLSYSPGWPSFCPKGHQRRQNLPTHMLIIETRSTFPQRQGKKWENILLGHGDRVQGSRSPWTMALCWVSPSVYHYHPCPVMFLQHCPCFSTPICENVEFSLHPEYDGSHITIMENYEPPKR